jgi:hypothetical protein
MGAIAALEALLDTEDQVRVQRSTSRGAHARTCALLLHLYKLIHKYNTMRLSTCQPVGTGAASDKGAPVAGCRRAYH